MRSRGHSLVHRDAVARCLWLGVVIAALSVVNRAQVADGQDRAAAAAIPGAALVLDSLRPAEQSRVRFAGARTYDNDELRAAIAEYVREIDEKGASPARADDAAYFVGSFYRKNGFAQVETDYSIRGGVVTVRIKEGPRTLLQSLRFTGNRAFTEEELYPYMIGATPERFAEDPELFPYNASEIEAGADRVRGFYVSEGYLDVDVDAAPARFSRGGRAASVVVSIKEGDLYTFGGIQFLGETVFEIPKLLIALRERPDGPFSRTKVVNMQRNLESYFRAHGYFQAEVEVQAEPALASIVSGRRLKRHRQVPITFTIEPGALFRFDGVTVRNESVPPGRLRKDFLPKRFRHLTGEIYDPEKVDETYRELLQTGLFTNLRLTPVAQPDDTVRLDFVIEEAKAREVGFTLGFGTYDGLMVGLRLADRNLFNNGRPLTFSADYSKRGLNAEFAYHDPWFLDNPKLDFRAKVFSVDREERGYSREQIGGRVDFGYKFTPRFKLSAFVQGSTDEIVESKIDPLLLGPLDYNFLSLGLAQTTDFRNDPVRPTRGWIFSSAFDLGLVDNEEAFTRGIARFSYYVPVGKMQLALGGRVGAIQPIAPTVPIDIRFFNGGATTVRSFPERELGPKDDGYPIGGEFFTVLNAELTFPLGFAGLDGAVFFDAGNVRSWSDRGVEDMRYAIGVGIRYALPVGPLRIDYGINPDRREDEPFGAFHLSFGVAF